MERIFDLPAHPLLVHFPVVAIPALALVALVLAARPALGQKWRLPVIGFAIVTAAATFFATQSGEALADALGNGDYIDDHEALGKALQLMVFGLLVLLVLLLFGPGPLRSNPGVNGALRALVGVVAVLALIWAVRTGHEGARIHWEGVLPSETDEATAASDTPTESETSTTEAETTTTVASTTTVAEVDTTTTTEADVDTSTTTTSLASDIDGMAVFESNCARCHGSDGGGGRGPSLVIHLAETDDPEADRTQIVEGGNGMPAFGNRLTAEEIDAVLGYLDAAFGEAA